MFKKNFFKSQITKKNSGNFVDVLAKIFLQFDGFFLKRLPSSTLLFWNLLGHPVYSFTIAINYLPVTPIAGIRVGVLHINRSPIRRINQSGS